MASIDWIYGNRAQYDELKSYVGSRWPWLLKGFYPYLPDDPNKEFRIASFSVKHDKFLLQKNIPMWARIRLLKMYASSVLSPKDILELGIYTTGLPAGSSIWDVWGALPYTFYMGDNNFDVYDRVKDTLTRMHILPISY